MPPLPSGAPTTGNAALIYWSALGATALLFVIFGALKFFYPSGKDRLDRKTKDESEAIITLRDQIEDMKETQHAQDKKLEVLYLHREKDAQTRTKMEGKVQALLTWCESYYDLMQDINSEWKDMPPHFSNRLERMKKPSDVLKRFD